MYARAEIGRGRVKQSLTGVRLTVRAVWGLPAGHAHKGSAIRVASQLKRTSNSVAIDRQGVSRSGADSFSHGHYHTQIFTAGSAGLGG
ncbi:MAG: hypothetical protein NVS3B29_07430 [Candidatus Saccharimonadales bacterium]